ncbi:hypothetical protein QA649_11500 [Bradyrhizobium sp. CB1717]|uniref:hypothetical protein n=1 Tax=Bradyrhizobium sp. CB1717 TaxID=3039154 RepID=UPI0024B212ED|nr:hypothetical protein [Bradyrhizobium sp. CB1717]WFU26800.1 hypothetical protein QA649_11500 [Bradyrhizobium sp. CB1717]
MQRRRSTPHSFEERLAAERMRIEKQAESLPPGDAKQQLLQKIEQIETACRIDKWLSSPGLQPPR